MKQPGILRVKYYETEKGKAPAKEWLDEITEGAKVKLVDLLKRLEDKGPLVAKHYPNYFSPLGDGLFEIRLFFRDIWYRLIYFYDKKGVVVCHGFIKKTNKAPANERQIARDRMKDYERRLTDKPHTEGSDAEKKRQHKKRR